MYIAVSMQQVSLYFTTAGNAGFITGLYVVVVPMLLLLKEQKIASHTIAAAGLSACGLYFLSVTEGFHINRGDLIVIVSTLFWAFHVLYIGRLSGRHNPIAISFFQFMTCSILSLISGALFEEISVAIVRSTMLPILYGGLISVGIGYTLQVVGQKYAPPHHAAVLMSMEAVFAVIGAFFIIGEEISGRAFFGCTLMFAGMVIAQTGNWFGKRTKE